MTLSIDTNGNRKLTIKNGKERATSIQTNGNLPRTHRDGIGEWTIGEVVKYRAIIAIGNQPARSAWDKAVKQYALELLESLEGNYTGAALLNGAENWSAHSYGGCSLIYDYEIAERLCSPSEFKRSKDGEKQPNSRETWLDCQARALGQAATRISPQMKLA